MVINGNPLILCIPCVWQRRRGRLQQSQRQHTKRIKPTDACKLTSINIVVDWFNNECLYYHMTNDRINNKQMNDVI